MLQKTLSIILGIIVIIAGVYACLQPVAAQVSVAGMMVIIVGVAMVICGVGEICAWNNERKVGISDSCALLSGIVSIILGVILLCCNFAAAGLVTATLMSYILAIWLVVCGIMRIVSGLKLRDFGKTITTSYNPNSMRESIAQQEIQQMTGGWGIVLVLGVLMIIAGILCLCSPVILIAFMGIIFGISMILAGVSILGLAIAAPTK